jgi:hypothetical protein
MAITTSNPVHDPDGNYELLGVNLAISPVWKQNEVGCSVAMLVTPFRVREGMIEQCNDKTRSQLYENAFLACQLDPDLAQCVGTIEAALQQFISVKGL